MELKSDFEFRVLWFDGDFFYFGISYIPVKGVFYFPDTIVNIFFRALCKHLHSAVCAIADEAG
jgi:hypothetical protein